MTEIYSKLLTGERFRKSSAGHFKVVSNAESDRGRLLFCPAFRRLQQKAQVFSMEPNAAVRSRLTHSLEVAQMGRYISDLVSIRLLEQNLATEEHCTALVTFVETACLMHDIGNPPFGHFGEAAIAEWFRKNGADVIIKITKLLNTGKNSDSYGREDPRIKNALFDFLEFDGNPQGLRIVLKLQRNSDEYGLNLTKTTIASYLKYIRTSNQSDKKESGPFYKKCGFFQTEKLIVDEVWKYFGYSVPQRFPLAYIMEAADDLAYCISDLEDSIEKGLLDKCSALKEIYQDWKTKLVHPIDKLTFEIDGVIECAINEYKNEEEFTFIDFRTSINRIIVAYCADQYIEKHDMIIAGTLNSLISRESGAGIILALLKEYCRKNVYKHESVQRVELAGYKAIYGLLEIYRCLMECDAERFMSALNYENKDSHNEIIVVEKKLLALFPENYVKVYKHDLQKLDKSDEEYVFKEWLLRAHLIVDYISGMTDDFAMNTYRELSGMRL